MFDSLYDLFGFDHIHAGHIAATARTVAIDAAGTAVEVGLYGILGRLLPPHKARIGVCGSPDADDRCGRQRSHVHIRRIHGEHHVEVTHQDQFLMHILKMLADVDA